MKETTYREKPFDGPFANHQLLEQAIRALNEFMLMPVPPGTSIATVLYHGGRVQTAHRLLIGELEVDDVQIKLGYTKER